MANLPNRTVSPCRNRATASGNWALVTASWMAGPQASTAAFPSCDPSIVAEAPSSPATRYEKLVWLTVPKSAFCLRMVCFTCIESQRKADRLPRWSTKVIPCSNRSSRTLPWLAAL